MPAIQTRKPLKIGGVHRSNKIPVLLRFCERPFEPSSRFKGLTGCLLACQEVSEVERNVAFRCGL